MTTIAEALTREAIKAELAAMSVEELQFVKLLIEIDSTMTIAEAIEITINRRGKDEQ